MKRFLGLCAAAAISAATIGAFAQVPSTMQPTPALPNQSIFAAAPTISSGFGSSPSVAASNGTAAFQINVGTGGSATSGVIGLPTAAHGWACSAADVTTQSATVFLTVQTASSTTSATLGNINAAGAAAAWVASDLLNVQCSAF